MLDEDARYVFVNRLVLRSSLDEAPPVPLDELITPLQERFQKGMSFKLLELETKALRIVSFEYRKSVPALILLMQLADLNIADPAFANLQTGTMRTVAKGPNEGVAVSAHVVIGLTPEVEGKTPGSASHYPMLIEEVPRLTRLQVSSLLRQELKKASKDAGFEYEIAPRQKRALRVKSEVQGVPADLFNNELSDAVLRGVELVTYEKVGDGLDDEITLKERKRSLLLKPAEPASGSKIDAIYQFARKVARKEGYKSLRLLYERGDGRDRTAALDVQAEGATDHLANALTRCEYLNGFKPPLLQCAPELRKDFVARMLKLM
jgi:hypothetical protein